MRKRKASFFIVLVSVTVLIAGLVKLVQLRFESGEAYPIRSSMRPDPMGAKVLYESYSSLPNLAVERNFKPFGQMTDLPGDAALLLLNVNGWELYELGGYELVEEFVEEGGRLIIGLTSISNSALFLEDWEFDEEDAEEEDNAPKEDEPDEDPESEEDAEEEEIEDSESEGILGDLRIVFDGRTELEATLVDTSISSLPTTLPWRRGSQIKDWEENWTALYDVEEQVVAVEQTLGKGSIVVFADDYLFSNEGLLKHRHSDLLVWILGGKDKVIFDETHLGVAERTGIATLIRRYQLSGFFVAFFLFMLVVVWRGASPLLPAHERRSRENLILADHSSEAGLADLIRRSLPLSELPAEAYRRWKASFIRSDADRKRYKAELAEVDELMANQDPSDSKKHPLKTHLAIQSIINRKKTKRL